MIFMGVLMKKISWFSIVAFDYFFFVKQDGKILLSHLFNVFEESRWRINVWILPINYKKDILDKTWKILTPRISWFCSLAFSGERGKNLLITAGIMRRRLSCKNFLNQSVNQTILDTINVTVWKFFINEKFTREMRILVPKFN